MWMEICMKDNGIIIKNMDLELSISIPMVKNTRENFRMERNMEKGFTISVNKKTNRLWRQIRRPILERK